jgi:hypothetical protein
LVIGFIALLKFGITSNYGAIADSHNLQFTTARTKSSLLAMASTSHCQETDVSNVLCFHAYVVASWLQSSRPCSCELHSLTNLAVHCNTGYSTQFSLALPGSGFQRQPFLCSLAELTDCASLQLNSRRRLDSSSPQLFLLIKPRGGTTENTSSVGVCNVTSGVPLSCHLSAYCLTARQRRFPNAPIIA